MSNPKRRVTIGQAFGSILGAITGVAALAERGVNTADKGFDVVDNMLDAGVKKSDNFKKRSALADDAEYLLEITSLIQLNPEIGEVYLSSPDMLPEGISVNMIRELLRDEGYAKPKALRQTHSSSSRSSSKTSSTNRVDFDNTDI